MKDIAGYYLQRAADRLSSSKWAQPWDPAIRTADDQEYRVPSYRRPCRRLPSAPVTALPSVSLSAILDGLSLEDAAAGGAAIAGHSHPGRR